MIDVDGRPTSLLAQVVSAGRVEFRHHGHLVGDIPATTLAEWLEAPAVDLILDGLLLSGSALSGVVISIDAPSAPAPVRGYPIADEDVARLRAVVTQ